MAPDQRQDSHHRSRSVHRLEFDVKWPPNHVAAYLIDDADPILVDVGMPSDTNERALRDQLAAHGYELADVRTVLVTHPHLDHVGLLSSLRAAGEPTVYAPRSYRDRLAQSRESREASVTEQVRRTGVPDDLIDSAVNRALDRFDEISSCLPADAVDGWVGGGETVDVGTRSFTAVHTPGHQRDHLCYETSLDGRRVSFSGDMAIQPFRAAAIHASFGSEQTEAISAYYSALDRLEGRGIDRVFPGHGPVHGEYATAITTARDGLDRLCSRTYEAVRPEGTHAIHAAMTRTEEFTDGPYIPEAIGALAHLEREGRLRSHLEDDVRYYVPA